MPQIDLSNPLLWIVILLSIFTLLHFAVTSALGLGLVIVVIKKAKTDLHTWAADLSSWLTGLGFSKTVTGPLDKLAAGDVPGAMAAGAVLAAYVLNPVNAATELSNVLPKLWADKTVGPPLQAVVKDLQGGATQQQLQTDLVPVITQARGSVPKGPLATQAQDLVAHLPTLAANPQLLDLANLLHLNGQADAIPALLAGHSVAAQAAGTIATTAVALPVAPAAAAVLAAPVAPAVAAGLAVPAGMKAVTSIIPQDHQVQTIGPAVVAPPVAQRNPAVAPTSQAA